MEPLAVCIGAPMFLADVTRGLLRTGVYKYGEDANMDETSTLLETMADMEYRK